MIEFTKTITSGYTSEEDVEGFEKNFNIKIPESFRQYLLKYNGFGIYPNTFLCDDNSGQNLEDSEDKIYQIGLERFDSIKDLEYDFDVDRIPLDLLTIGRCDGGGNRILIGISGDKYGKIYYWDHNNEQDLDEDNQSYINIYYVCESFEELINEKNLK